MKRLLLIISMKPNILVGGQAVIEGVMMRVTGAYSTAVRCPNGDIKIKRKEFLSITARYFFGLSQYFEGLPHFMRL